MAITPPGPEKSVNVTMWRSRTRLLIVIVILLLATVFIQFYFTVNPGKPHGTVTTTITSQTALQITEPGLFAPVSIPGCIYSQIVNKTFSCIAFSFGYGDSGCWSSYYSVIEVYNPNTASISTPRYCLLSGYYWSNQTMVSSQFNLTVQVQYVITNKTVDQVFVQPWFYWLNRQPILINANEWSILKGNSITVVSSSLYQIINYYSQDKKTMLFSITSLQGTNLVGCYVGNSVNICE